MLEGGARDEVVGGNKKGDDLISHPLFYVDCNPRLKYCHNCCYECKDSVELWESGVDQSVSLNIVTL